MNLGSFLLGVLLMVLLIRSTYWWVVQDLAAHWYREQSMGVVEHPAGKPWYVRRHDRWEARRRRRWERS